MWEAGAPGGQAASLGSQDFVNPWLLVPLVESGAGVRAALASAPWEGALEGFLLVLAALPAPCLPPQKSRAGFGLELQQGKAPGPSPKDLPGAPGPWAPLGLSPLRPGQGRGICRAFKLFLSPPPPPELSSSLPIFYFHLVTASNRHLPNTYCAPGWGDPPCRAPCCVRWGLCVNVEGSHWRVAKRVP